MYREKHFVHKNLYFIWKFIAALDLYIRSSFQVHQVCNEMIVEEKVENIVFG